MRVTQNAVMKMFMGWELIQKWIPRVLNSVWLSGHLDLCSSNGVSCTILVNLDKRFLVSMPIFLSRNRHRPTVCSDSRETRQTNNRWTISWTQDLSHRLRRNAITTATTVTTVTTVTTHCYHCHHWWQTLTVTVVENGGKCYSGDWRWLWQWWMTMVTGVTGVTMTRDNSGGKWSQWWQAVTNGDKWWQVVTSGDKRWQLVTSGDKWRQVVTSCENWQVVTFSNITLTWHYNAVQEVLDYFYFLFSPNLCNTR
jgi:hypothetical protein